MDNSFSLIFLKLLVLLLTDVIFVGLLGLCLSPLLFSRKAAYAVLKRNFVGYFTNPTGYVFLCLFVLITSFVAFWPHEFFNANLANLDQLNKYLPFIMLVYIPAITMSVWADERRQGTDELLLTIPATDFDIVMGKFLAAATIFTASLLFSQICNFLVLLSLSLGEVDVGLLYATYIGYWLIGLAMLAVGMVASFLVNNLTVSFILGVAFNAPLAFAGAADVIIPKRALADAIARWSFAGQFEGIGRGVIDAAAVSFFLMVTMIGLYICMVLIGRRHWVTGNRGLDVLGVGAVTLLVGLGWVFWSLSGAASGAMWVRIGVPVILALAVAGMAVLAGGQAKVAKGDREFLFGHYLLRGVALVLLGIGCNLVFANALVLRFDATKNKVATLSSDTVRLINQLDVKHPVLVDAYLSADVPEQWAKSKREFLSVLKEFERNGSKIRVQIHDNLAPFGDEAQQASDQYGIKPMDVRVRSRGVYREDQLIFGVAFTSGLQRLVIPFFEHGVPVEYTLARALKTVSEPEKKKLAVILTDAKLFEDVVTSPMSMQQEPIEKKLIITELEARYAVEKVAPDKPIDAKKYDAMLLVQPSTLSNAQLENVMTAMRDGLPTAIFEDPMPSGFWGRGAVPPGTGRPKMNAMPFGQQRGPTEKCDLTKLFDLVGVRMIGEKPKRRIGNDELDDPMLFRTNGWDAKVAKQDYNPYPKVRMFARQPEFLFASDNASPDGKSFDPNHKITAGLQEVLFVAPGALQPISNTKLKITQLVRTSENSNVLRPEDLSRTDGKHGYAKQRFNLAVAIEGAVEPAAGDKKEKEKQGDSADKDKDKNKDKDADKHDDHDDHDGDHDGDKVDKAKGSETEDSAARKHKANQLKVVFVADIDILTSLFVHLRNNPEQDVDFQFDNVPFVLNIVDFVAGNEDLMELCKRRPRFASLKMIDEQTRVAREDATTQEERFKDRFDSQDGIIEEMTSVVGELQREDDEAFQTRVRELNARTAVLDLLKVLLPAEGKPAMSQDKVLTAVEEVLTNNQRLDGTTVGMLQRIVEQQHQRADTKDEPLELHFTKVTGLLDKRAASAAKTREADDSAEGRRKPLARLDRLTSRVVETRASEADKNTSELRDDIERERKSVEQIRSITDLTQEIKELKARAENGESVATELEAKVGQLGVRGKEIQDTYRVDKERIARERKSKHEANERELELSISRIQNWYKFLAVMIPPLPPLLVGLVVFARRRLREREGMSRNRLR